MFFLAQKFAYSYEDIKLLKKQNPKLVEDYENDFKKAEKISLDIWIGEKYFFFADRTGLKIYEFAEIKELHLFHYRLQGGTFGYGIESLDNERRFSVRILERGYSEDNVQKAYELVERIQKLSNAKIDGSF